MNQSYKYIIVVICISLLSCRFNFKQQSSSVYSAMVDINKLLLEDDITSDKERKNIYSLSITDISNVLIKDIQIDPSKNILIATSEDENSNSRLLQFDPETGKIINRSDMVYRLGGYIGNSSDYWFSYGRFSILWYSKTDLKKNYSFSVEETSFLLSADRFFVGSGNTSTKHISCISFTKHCLWSVDLDEIAIQFTSSTQIFFNCLFERKNQLLLFSYVDSEEGSNKKNLFYWIFDRDTGKVMYVDRLVSNFNSTEFIPLIWEGNDIFHQKEDSVIFTRLQKNTIFINHYIWDGAQPLKLAWSKSIPKRLDQKSEETSISLHPTIFSDTTSYWLVLNERTDTESKENLFKSNLLCIDRKTGQIQKDYRFDEIVIQKWMIDAQQMLFTFLSESDSVGVASFSIPSQHIKWGYRWRNGSDVDRSHEVMFVSGIAFLQTSIQSESENPFRTYQTDRILLRMINPDGKIIPIHSLKDNYPLELKKDNIPYTYIPDFTLYFISQIKTNLLIITNRGGVYRFELEY